MEWKTAISYVEDGKEIIRGEKLSDLIVNKTFVETIFLILRGTFPNAKETTMLNALLTASIDHGIGTPSTMTARITASTKNSMHTAIAAGILAMGELHGSAIEGAAQFFQENKNTADAAKLVAECKAKKMRIPGFGHKVFTSHDPRTQTLLKIAKELGFYGDHTKFAVATEEQLAAQSSKKLPLNIDGVMAAILSDMGFDYSLMKGVFIIGRVPGLVAHVYEEQTTGTGIRRIDPKEEIYIGKGA